MSTTYAEQTITVAAGGSGKIHYPGNMIRIQTTTAPVIASAPELPSDKVRLDDGQFVRFRDENGELQSFTYLVIENDTGSDITLTALVGTVEFGDRQVTGEVWIKKPTNGATPNSLTVNAGSTMTVVATDTSMIECEIQADHSNGNHVLVGRAASAFAGIRLDPGQSRLFIGTKEIKVHNPGTVGATINIEKVQD